MKFIKRVTPFVVAISAMAFAGSVHAADTIKIGIPQPMTGPATQYGLHAPSRDRVRALRTKLDRELAGVDLATVSARLTDITRAIRKLMEKELSGPVYEDLIVLKSLHSRYRNYAEWLRQRRAHGVLGAVPPCVLPHVIVQDT